MNLDVWTRLRYYMICEEIYHIQNDVLFMTNDIFSIISVGF